MKCYRMLFLTHPIPYPTGRLSWARRVVESAFGILSNRFRFLHTTLQATPERARAYDKAACVLHNYLRVAQCRAGDSSDAKEAAIRTPLPDLLPSRSRASAKATHYREQLCLYFCGQGAIPDQDEHAFNNVQARMLR